MKTAQEFAPIAMSRVNNYLSTLKHPSTLKFVKGISQSHKTLIGIIVERGGYITLKSAEIEAFELCEKGKAPEQMTYIVDILIGGKIAIIPYN